MIRKKEFIYTYSLWVGLVFLLGTFTSVKGENQYWLWPVRWVNQFDYLFILRLLLGSSIAISISLLKFKNNLTLRILHFVSLFLSFSILYSFGKIAHNMHGFIYILFFFIFVGHSEPINKLAYRFGLSAFFMTYGLSGLWKLRALIEALHTNSIESIEPLLKWHIASAQIHGNKVTVLSQIFLEWPDSFAFCLWIGIVLFELLAFLPIITGRHQKKYVLGILFFHIAAYFVAGINFLPTALLALIVFI